MNQFIGILKGFYWAKEDKRNQGFQKFNEISLTRDWLNQICDTSSLVYFSSQQYL